MSHTFLKLKPDARIRHTMGILAEQLINGVSIGKPALPDSSGVESHLWNYGRTQLRSRSILHGWCLYHLYQPRRRCFRVTGSDWYPVRWWSVCSARLLSSDSCAASTSESYLINSYSPSHSSSLSLTSFGIYGDECTLDVPPTSTQRIRRFRNRERDVIPSVRHRLFLGRSRCHLVWTDEHLPRKAYPCSFERSGNG